jgi:dipeptidase
MKYFKLTIIFIIMVLFLLTISIPALGCTGVGLGKGASVDGSVLNSLTQDGCTYDFRLKLIPAQDHEPGAMRNCADYPQQMRWFDPYGNPKNAEEIYVAYDRRSPLEGPVEKFEIPQVPHTFAYFTDLFGCMNEHQVGFAMASLGTTQALWNDEGKLRISQLSMIAAERATTAREAIQIMGEMAEKYGFRGEYGPGKMLGVSDPNEFWIFEVMQSDPFWTADSGKSGAIWVAQRVPDDHVCLFPNGSPIQEIDFDDPDHFMYSENIQSVAIENGWYDPDSGIPFSVVEAYLEGKSEGLGTLTRKWSGYRLIAPSLDLPDPYEANNMKDEYGRQYRYPFSVKPDKKMSPRDLMAINRDYFQGTKYDLSKGPLAGPFEYPFRYTQVGGSLSTADGDKYSFPRSIATVPNYTKILQTRNWLPNAIGGIIWWSPSRATCSTYVPVYCGINEVTENFSEGNNYNIEWRHTLMWAAALVDMIMESNWAETIGEVTEMQHIIEKEATELVPLIDKIALEIYESSPEKAKEFLTQWSNQYADDVTRRYWDFAEYEFILHRLGGINTKEEGSPPDAYPHYFTSIPDKDYWVKLAIEYQKNVIGNK